MSIWKFAVDTDRNLTEMPQGAKVLHAHEQGGQACVWAEVNPEAPMVLRRLFVVATGDHAPPMAAYVGTVHLLLGRLVLHVYDGGES